MKGRKSKVLALFLMAGILIGNTPVSVSAASAPDTTVLYLYNDVVTGQWYYDDVIQITESGIMSGYADECFGPGDLLNRSQFATILYRMEGCPDTNFEALFPDVADNQFYSEAVTWAAKNGLITGYTSNHHFGPNDYITREQLATMMYRYAEYKGYDVSETADYSSFPDADLVTEFAQTAIGWSVEKGLITGKNGNLEAWNNACRAECSAIINRFVGGYSMKIDYSYDVQEGYYEDVRWEGTQFLGSYSVFVEKAGTNRVNIGVTYLGRNYSPIYDTGVIYNVPVVGNKAVFIWEEDGWGNSGEGRITFNENSLNITMRLTKESDWNRATLARESYNLPYIGTNAPN